MHAVLTGARFQVLSYRDDLQGVQALLVAPVMAYLLTAVLAHSGRADLAGHAITATGLMTLWNVTVATAGQFITRERTLGTLELTLAARVPPAATTTGRALVVTTVGSLGLVEAVVVTAIVLGVTPTVAPLTLAVALALAVLTTTAGALLVAAAFVLSRTTRVYQAALTYPVYLLGGLLVPVDQLPAWAQWPCRLVPLSWNADLLRAAFAGRGLAELTGPVTAAALLGVLGWGAGALTLAHVTARACRTGEVLHA